MKHAIPHCYNSFRSNYSSNPIIIKTITPGIPKNPAIKAVIGLIANEKFVFIPIKLRLAIIKFAMYNITTPIIPFIISFNGHFNSFKTKNSTTIPANP